MLHYYVGGEPAAVAERIDSDHATEEYDGGMFRENVKQSVGWMTMSESRR